MPTALSANSSQKLVKDVIDLLAELEVTPSSMIDISDGLSSEIITSLERHPQVGFHAF